MSLDLGWFSFYHQL